MKKAISLILFVMVFLNTCAIVDALEIKGDVSAIEFSAPVNIGKPIKSTTLLNCVTGIEDGKPTLYTTVSGSPAKFNVFDLESGTTLRSFDMEKGNTVWMHAIDSKGNVYLGGYTRATLYRYSPVDKSFTDLGLVPGASAICAFAIDEKDNVYMGTYPKATIVKYDAKTNDMIELGNPLPGDTYMKSLFFYKGNLYGGGDSIGTKFMKMNLQTFEVTHINGPNTSSPIKSYYSGRVSGNKAIIYCGTESSGSINIVFDFEKEKFLDIEVPKANGLYASPEIDGYAYFVADRKLLKYNLKDDTYEQTNISYGSGFRGGDFVELKTHSNLPNKTYANVLFGGEVSLIDFKTGERLTYAEKIDVVGTPLESVHAIGDYVYASGHMGPSATQYNPKTRAIIANFPMGQSRQIKEINGKIYFSSYPSVDLQEFDPTKPVVKDVNPVKIFEVGKANQQSRPMDIVQAGDKIVISTIADYGLLQGAIIVTDPVTLQTDVYKNIINNQSISGLAYKDGILYGSTTIAGGLGSVLTEQEAKIFKFDMSTRKVTLEVVPKPKTVTGFMKMAGGLTFGPDGLLWSVSDGLVFAMNPDTLEVVKEKDVNGYNWGSNTRWVPYTVKFDKDGMLYCTPGNTAVVLNPETMEFKKILPSEYDGQTGEISLSDDGYLYFKSRDSIMSSQRIDAGASVSTADNFVVLMLHSIKSLVKGQEKTLDVSPKTVNDRTVVPIRFISESFNANVDWDEATSKVTITKGETVINVTLGESKLIKNGVEIPLDTAAFTENDRTLLPLRAVVEALDKKVFWDDRGLIVMGDVILDKDKDKDKIEELILKVK